jgi:hypothetical protein
MITVAEIKKKADRLYPEVLKSGLLGESFFPKAIRADKGLSKDFVRMSKEIAEVMAGSKDRKGFGYIVQSKPTKTRLHGIQDLPNAIEFESLMDYLKFIGREKEYKLFVENCLLIQTQIPQLNDWLIRNPLAVIRNFNKWEELLKVCDWFLHHFEEDKYYIRELPIAVHTKFIEENKGVLMSLLDKLIPDRLDPEESEFERRFRLKYPQPVIRYRLLDYVSEEGRYTDIAVPLDQFVNIPLSCQIIFIVENQMNFLTFPKVENSISIWGKGFALESLKEVSWFSGKDIFYWSDLDAQGFQMLSQLRCYFPQTRALLMDKEVLSLYWEFVVEGTPCKVQSLVNLSMEEEQVFNYLSAYNLRLEQERIPQVYVEEKIMKYLLI